MVSNGEEEGEEEDKEVSMGEGVRADTLGNSTKIKVRRKDSIIMI